uniref:zinc finger and SCAN domain-containing protein 2-like n=1 Tax=Doryrhamphus excisus TaxID=161450 RepID=UPI0025ADA7AD|nr:zinc finger and SCAN domain-containing protein 2-like [Doryrhamphus excisus]
MGRYRKGQKMRNTDLWERAGGRETVIRSFVANGFTRATIPGPERWAAIARHLFGESDLRLQKWLRTVWVENRRGIRNDLLKEKGVQQLIEYQQEQKGITTLKQEDPLLLHVKQEEEEVRITQEGECLLGKEEVGLTMLPLTGVSVKTEDHEDKSPESSQLHHNPSEENRGAEPRSSISPQHITTGADGDHCGGAETDNLIAPLSDSDDITSHSEDEDRDYAQEPLSSDTDDEGDMRTHTDNKHSKKKTDVQQLIGHQGERPPQLLVGGSILKQEDPQTPKVKEEDEALRITHEGLQGQEEADLSRLPLTGVSVKTEDHEDKPRVQQLVGRQGELPRHPQGGISSMKQEDPQPPHIKEEEEELWTTQEGECLLGKEEADLTRLRLTVVSVKTEDHEDKPPESSQLHYSPSEENRGAEPQHMTAEADNLLAPLSDSDDVTSHSPEDEDRGNTQEPLSSDTDCEDDMRTHTDNKRHVCSKKKTGKKRFRCLVCDKTFFYQSYLSRHAQTHGRAKVFSCSVCCQGFSVKSHMLSHMTTHTGERPFSCSACGSTFSQMSSLNRHSRTHTGEKPFSCSVCGDTFSQTSSLNTHMRTHTGEKPFSCSSCGKSFAKKINMVSHMRTHTGEKPFSCTVCGQGFAHKSTVVSHMRTHTGEKPFSCSVCGDTFTQTSSLNTHMRTHTGEKPFSCSNCGRRFAKKGNMVLHMRTHSGEKPFSCSVCSDAFSQVSSLNTHMRTHTGEKPFSCPDCDKSFTQKAHMRSHMRTHSGETQFSDSD